MSVRAPGPPSCTGPSVTQAHRGRPRAEQPRSRRGPYGGKARRPGARAPMLGGLGPGRAIALGLLAAVALAACRGSDGRTELLVSAAASLTDAFVEIERAFEADHPDVDVLLNFGGSAALREQILEGAPVDLFASANAANMSVLAAEGLIFGMPRVFATNELQIAVPAGNPAAIVELADLEERDLLIGLCHEAVPCGDYGRQVLTQAGVRLDVDTNEPDVRALLTKIATGELDAGITYATDVQAAAGQVEGIVIPSAVNVAVSYPIAAVGGSEKTEPVSEFLAFVLSAEGQRILRDHGFGPP